MKLIRELRPEEIMCKYRVIETRTKIGWIHVPAVPHGDHDL